MNFPHDKDEKFVVIVGSGISGLACARKLLEGSEHVKVLVVEASDAPGGRIRGVRVGGTMVDLGAEFVHGKGTILTRWIHEFQSRGVWDAFESDECEEIFTLSHADGGGRPDDEPTADGKYGMFFHQGELLMYNDPSIEPLNIALENMLTLDTDDPLVSVLDALNKYNLPPHLLELAKVGYGHTAGSCDLSKLSLMMMQHFERHWDENEEAGDLRLPPGTGMQAVVDSCCQLLERYPRFELKLDSPVIKIDETSESTVLVTTAKEIIECDRVVVTIPPSRWSSIEMALPKSKLESAAKIGFPRAIKVILFFSERIWPEDLQTLICTSQPIPELWFRSTPTFHMAVGFLMSDAADEFADCLMDTSGVSSVEEVATSIFTQQLSEVLNLQVDELADLALPEKTIVHDWGRNEHIRGGYMFPKVGVNAQDLANVAAQSGRLHFAGEATNTNAGCTVQAAMETGERAGAEILSCEI